MSSTVNPQVMQAVIQALRQVLNVPGVQVIPASTTRVQVIIPSQAIERSECSYDGYDDSCTILLINGKAVTIKRRAYGPRGVYLENNIIAVSKYEKSDQRFTLDIDLERDYMTDPLGDYAFRVRNKNRENHECYLISIKKQDESYCVELDGCEYYTPFVDWSFRLRNICGKTPQEALSNASKEWLEIYKKLSGLGEIQIPTPFDKLLSSIEVGNQSILNRLRRFLHI